MLITDYVHNLHPEEQALFCQSGSLIKPLAFSSNSGDSVQSGWLILVSGVHGLTGENHNFTFIVITSFLEKPEALLCALPCS